MKVVLVMLRGGKRRDFPLGSAHTTIGRRNDCSLRIPAADVSRRHCEISTLDRDVVVRDLGSANGTFVNGKRIAEKALKPGDRLLIGPVEFIIQIDGQPANPAAAPPAAPSKPTPSPAAKPPPSKPAHDEKTSEKTPDDDFNIDDELDLLVLDDLEEEPPRSR